MTTPVPRDEPGTIPQVADYSRLGFKALRALVKSRGLPADGTLPQLIEKLKAYDAQHGLEPNIDVPDGAGADEEVDLLADDDPPTDAPAGGGEAASPPPPAGPPAAPASPVLVGAPAVTVTADPDQPTGPPAAKLDNGRNNLAAKGGVVKVGEAHGAAAVRAFRQEYPIGTRDLTDDEHFRLIAETHAMAHAAGLATKGGHTIGERVGYAVDAAGVRTVIYQVPLKRVR